MSMNNHFREPQKLVFSPYTLYECTTNDKKRRYAHTNIVLLIEVPSRQILDGFGRIEMLLAPSHLQHVSFLDDPTIERYPSKEDLIDQGWKIIFICSVENEVTIDRSCKTKRKQYSLRHIGAGTIDSVQGETIYSQFVFECNIKNSPWMKSQVVVLLSRVLHSIQMIIIGDKRIAIDILWRLICTPTQWTAYMERKLHMLSINATGDAPEKYNFDVGSIYPFRITDYVLPDTDTGFVYCIGSLKNPNYSYIGKSKSLTKRITSHNSGNGAAGTSDLSNAPYYIAGYITGFESFSDNLLLSIERQWNAYASTMKERQSLLNIISQGERIVQELNAISQSNHNDRFSRVIFVRLVENSV